MHPPPLSPFLTRYPDDYQPRHGPLRPTTPQVIEKFVNRSTLEHGFARILAAVPHRHYVLAPPKMFLAYFQRHRPRLEHLCTEAHESLTLYLRYALGNS